MCNTSAQVETTLNTFQSVQSHWSLSNGGCPGLHPPTLSYRCTNMHAHTRNLTQILKYQYMYLQHPQAHDHYSGREVQ